MHAAARLTSIDCRSSHVPHQNLTSLHNISNIQRGALHKPTTLYAFRKFEPITIECRAARSKNEGGSRPRGPPGQKSRGNAPTKSDAGPQRLNKAIASAGVASRRSADELIFAGRVAVNGKVVHEPGIRVDLARDKVQVDGKLLSTTAATDKYYFALNKPKGYICSSKGDGSRGSGDRLVIDLFANWVQVWKQQHSGASHPPRLFTVGRLDVQTVGLIFVTNDGDWAQRVQHPSAGITKEYSCTIDRKPTRAQLDALSQGTVIDGVSIVPVAIALDDSDPGKTQRLRIVLSEGRNREVRRLVESVGLEVRGLRRLRIGGYRLPRTLGFGEFVQLRPWEVRRVTDQGADRMQ